MSQPAFSAACPTGIDGNDCVANDLQPTGTEIINGPTHCTLGDTFSATLRVKFDNGGGANTRYSVGFFVGDNGEQPIGGASCTFDSLHPLGPPQDLTGGSGGFENFNGDNCGDIGKSSVTYKDIDLNQVKCRDDDGDGLVDIGYVLTWVNNGNNENCTDPTDPGQFDPTPPKCLSELEYDLPIEVELPPSIAVAKGVFPSRIHEPGGLVDIVFTIINDSPAVSDPITVTSIIDNPLGDLTNSTSCTLPFTLAKGELKNCSISRNITGVAGDEFPDTVTVTGMDDEGNVVSDSDSASVEIIGDLEPPQPGDLRLKKLAAPSRVREPGGDVVYEVLLANVSATGIVINELVDDIYGDLNGKGSCVLPITLRGENSLYICSFREHVSGQAGDIITDVITATGNDFLPTRTKIRASDDASVEIINRRSDLEVIKTANPGTVSEPGGMVSFPVQIQNKSLADSITVQTIVDSRLGDVSPDCPVPFTLAPGEIFHCSFSGLVSGSAGDVVTNVLNVTGVDDDGQPNFDSDAASVFVIGTPPTVEVTKVALPPVALEAGSDVTYLVAIENTSSSGDTVTIRNLEDVVQDNAGTVRDLNGVGSCALPLGGLVLPPAPDPDSRYICAFTETVDGSMTTPANSPLVDTVTATGTDDEGTAVGDSDSATVTFLASLPTVPELEITKTASPVEVQDPGGNVTYSVIITNASPPGNGFNLTVSDLNDDIYGSLNGQGDCASAIGTILAPGDFVACSFTESVSGPSGTVVTDVITATATYLSGVAQVQDSDDATVTIVDIPSSLGVIKTANPVAVHEPGGDVTFSVELLNTSQVDQLTITSLTDSIYGDLDGQGNCSSGQVIAVAASYHCQFTVFVAGQGGEEERNTLLAIARDDDGQEVQGSDQASVVILDKDPTITAVKVANPGSVPPEGGAVQFTFTATNTSAADEVTLDTISDSIFGDLDGRGNCSVPQVLKPGELYSCHFSAEVQGVLGTTHLDTIQVTGTSDDGDRVEATASAIVRIVAAVREIPAIGQVLLLVLACSLLVAGVKSLRR